MAATARFTLTIRSGELLQWVEYIPTLIGQAGDIRAICRDSYGGCASV